MKIDATFEEKFGGFIVGNIGHCKLRLGLGKKHLIQELDGDLLIE